MKIFSHRNAATLCGISFCITAVLSEIIIRFVITNYFTDIFIALPIVGIDFFAKVTCLKTPLFSSLIFLICRKSKTTDNEFCPPNERQTIISFHRLYKMKLKIYSKIPNCLNIPLALCHIYAIYYSECIKRHILSKLASKLFSVIH